MNLRDKVIYILESNRGSFVSGQTIASLAIVSRNAVSKCVNSLKNDGFIIESVNNMGHRLDPACDILTSAGIRAYLDSDPEIFVFEKIDSTNSEAKRRISDIGDAEAIFATLEQTAGRGRRGRSFYSPKESGLYFSIVLHPSLTLNDATSLTTATAVAVCEAIKEATKKDPKIKWVNDIFIDGKKVCGILTEAVSDFESGTVQAVIIGIGINLTTEDFPEDLQGIASSLGTRVIRNALVADIFKRVRAICLSLPDKAFMNDYRKNCLVLGRSVNFEQNGVVFNARALNVEDDGTLLVETDSSEIMRLNSGEISVKL